MKQFVALLICYLLATLSFAQSVPFPPNPGNTGKLEPWGYTQNGTNWDTSPFLPFIFNGLHMRLMPPNGFTYNRTTKTWTVPAPAGKKYPLILFFHGNGETGTDNNLQLLHGGLQHEQAIQSGAFPGFAFYPQAVTYDQAKAILERIIIELPIDINSIYVHGLSAGATKTLTFTETYPTMVAAAFPMSGSDVNLETQTLLYTPFREAQGSLDINPTPVYSQVVVDWFNANGGHLEYFLLPGVGHGTWDYMYSRSDFFTWFLAQHKNTIEVRYNRNLLCPEAPISVDMGFTPGFDSYEWSLNGVTIAGQNAAKLIATAYGTYSGRIKNRGVWSDWATPVTVGVKSATNTPPIQANGLKSIVLPAPDGSTTSELTLPAGYASYSWKNASNTVVSTSQVYTAVPVGTYTASAMEVNGCATIPSPPFTVINATGPNSPDAIDDFLGYATSSTNINLSWADKPSPNYNETGFEIYRSAAGSNGPYTMVGLTAADAVGFNDTNLTPNVTYSYKVRPVNQYSAGPVSSVISVLTQVDNIAPTAPSNFATTNLAPNSVSFSWTGSTDNVGVFRYDIYKNGAKVISTASTTGTVYNLIPGTVYSFVVEARDMAGNSSTASNQITIDAGATGLQYKYYETATALSTLPDFTTLTPVLTGYTPNIDLSVRRQDVNFAMYWSGSINIPVAGSYQFATTSDDGSKLYIGGYGESFKVVDNNGAHGSQTVWGTKNFPTAGTYPIVITYFQGGGGYAMSAYWRNTASGVVTQTLIPNSAFAASLPVGGNPPAPPSGLVLNPISFDKINLTWTDNSTNENGFRIYRATSNTGPFVPVATVGAGSTTYQDQQLTGATKYYYRISAFSDFGESGFSSDVPRGLNYSYYEAVNMTSLTQIQSLAPAKTGVSSFFDISVRDRSENMVLRWQGKINITTAATWTFYANSDDGSTLSIDGSQIVSNDTDGNQHEKSGTKALTVGWHDIDVKWRKHTNANSRLTISYARPGVGKTAISTSNSTAFFYGTEINATTPAKPAPPLTPTNVVATNAQPTTIVVTWQDNAIDETSYQILRSYKQNTNYVNFSTLPANSTSFTDQGLFANGTYFYKVQAVGAGGASTSSEVSVTTTNNPPVLTALQDASFKYGATLNVDLVASDPDGDPITFTVTGLPSFGTMTDYHDGTGLLMFTPSVSQLGQYLVTVTAQDNHGGIATSPFTLTVTDKAAPVILPIINQNVDEVQVINFQIQATSDFGSSSLNWSLSGLPSFATPSIVDGLVSIALAPGYTDSGVYPVNVTVTDPLSSTTKTFTITVNDINPDRTVLVNMVSTTYPTAAGPPWNNMNSPSLSNLLDSNGASTATSVQFQTPYWPNSNLGAVTGNNSGIYPDNVIKDYFFFGYVGYPETVDVTVSGLDVTQKYYFNFFASSIYTGVPDNGSTIYTINNTSVSLNVQGNSKNVAKINSVAPNPDGTVTFTMSKAAGTPVGYLNAFSYTMMYQDGTAPAAPRNAQAAVVNNHVALTWVDAPFNEDGFDVYRSTSSSGPFVKIDNTPLATNSTSFNDMTALSGTTYYYQVNAFNAFGQSSFSNTAYVTTPALPPLITVSGPVSISTNATGTVSISTSSDATLTLSNVPGFAVQNQLNPSAIDVALAPHDADAGSYQMTATALNGSGLTISQNITITVTANPLFSISVNFSGSTNAPAPWNNTYDITPAAGDTYPNLMNDSGTGSGVSLVLQTSFGGYSNLGAQTGNNSGVVPDAVLKDYYWFGWYGAAGDIYMKLTGLNVNNRYKFKFTGSSTFDNGGLIADNGSTVFSIGSQSVSVNVENNTSRMGVIDNVVTSSTGEVVVHLSKASDATIGYINGMIIEAYTGDPTRFNPTLLTAAASSKTQIGLNWSDNSPVETGYEIQRSTTGAADSYSVITTTAPDVSSFVDVVPASGGVYYYRVRATLQSGFSEFTNVASSGVVSVKVYINCDAPNSNGQVAYDAPAPWNNTGRFGLAGDIFVGFRDDSGLNTGLRMRVQTPLEAGLSWGYTTGNNSGIFPDKVLMSSWANDAYAPPGVFIIDGLDQTFNYNFGFLGSMSINSAIGTDYTINGVTVTNMNNNNATNVSYIRNIRPDINGEIQFSIKESGGSTYSNWNALVIEGFATDRRTSSAGRIAAQNGSRDVAGTLREIRYGEATNILSFYPNPVVSDLNIVVKDGSIGDIEYALYDLLGREVKQGRYKSDAIDAEFKVLVDLPPALYLIKVVYPDGGMATTKFVRN